MFCKIINQEQKEISPNHAPIIIAGSAVASQSQIERIYLRKLHSAPIVCSAFTPTSGRSDDKPQFKGWKICLTSCSISLHYWRRDLRRRCVIRSKDEGGKVWVSNYAPPFQITATMMETFREEVIQIFHPLNWRLSLLWPEVVTKVEQVKLCAPLD